MILYISACEKYFILVLHGGLTANANVIKCEETAVKKKTYKP